MGQETRYDTNKMTVAQPADVAKFQGGNTGENSAADSFMVTNIPSRLKSACACKTAEARWDPIYVDPAGHHPTVSDDQITPSHDVSVRTLTKINNMLTTGSL